MILASQSPRRIELMHEAGYDPAVQPADIDETPNANETPFDLVERLATEKASAIARAHAGSGELVIGADTVVVADDRALGKPASPEDARRMLGALSGRTHQVATGVAIVHAGDEPRVLDRFTSVTDVRFYPLSPAEIEAYIATGEPFDKAGAYGIQGRGRMLIEGIDGDFYNVVGLPVAELSRRLRALDEQVGA